MFMCAIRGKQVAQLEEWAVDHHVLKYCRHPSDQGVETTVTRQYVCVNRNEGQANGGTPSRRDLRPTVLLDIRIVIKL